MPFGTFFFYPFLSSLLGGQRAAGSVMVWCGSQFYIQLVYKVTFSFTLKVWIKSWNRYPQKKLRNTLNDSFPYCPDLPKWPKQKNSCSKMWLIDQLYIKLGCCWKNAHNSKDIWEIMIFVKSLHFVYYILVLWKSISNPFQEFQAEIRFSFMKKFPKGVSPPFWS